MSGITRQRGETRVFQAEGKVSRGREQGTNEEQWSSKEKEAEHSEGVRKKGR